MKTFKCYLTAFTFLFCTAAHAQSRNGYKVNGITVAGGNGEGSAASQLSMPMCICVDAFGNLYVADRENNRVQKWAPGASEGTTVAGGNGRGSAANQLSAPMGICVDAAGNLYVVDVDNNRVQKWAPAASEGVTVAGGNGKGKADDQLNGPGSIYIDAAGNLYVADISNYRIQKWPRGAVNGIMVAHQRAVEKTGNQASIAPHGIWVEPSGNLYVADARMGIQKWAPGATLGVTVANGNVDNQLGMPGGICMDASGSIFVADLANHQVLKWRPAATKWFTVAGGFGKGNGAGQLNNPANVWVDAEGSLYVSDRGNNRVQKFEKDPPNKVVPKPKPTEVIVSNKPVSPPPAPTYTIFSWQKPVSDFADLPDGAYHTQVASAPVKVRITSSAAIDQAGITLQINGHALSNDGKSRLVDLNQVNRKPGSRQLEYEYSTTVGLQNGTNNIQLFYNGASSEVLPVIYQPQALNLYVLSIGTNKSLKFAVKDAADFAAMFSNQSSVKKYFTSVHAETLTGNDARAGTMVDKIGELAQREFKSNDVLVLFISSHGKVINNEYRIMGSDFESTKVEKTSVNFQSEVMEPLRSLACKKFIFLDACYSGSSLGNGPKELNDFDISREVGRMVSASDSVTIITSSSGTQQSWEDPKWQNGAFTKALREAMQEGKADANGNGIVDMDELFAYLTKRVPQLVREADKRNDNNEAVTQTPGIKNPKGNVSIYVY